jgi:actin-related protein
MAAVRLRFFLENVRSCTDEVGAVVFDIGHHSFRAGFAGEEFPKVRYQT